MGLLPLLLRIYEEEVWLCKIHHLTVVSCSKMFCELLNGCLWVVRNQEQQCRAQGGEDMWSVFREIHISTWCLKSDTKTTKIGKLQRGVDWFSVISSHPGNTKNVSTENMFQGGSLSQECFDFGCNASFNMLSWGWNDVCGSSAVPVR